MGLSLHGEELNNSHRGIGGLLDICLECIDKCLWVMSIFIGEIAICYPLQCAIG